MMFDSSVDDSQGELHSDELVNHSTFMFPIVRESANLSPLERVSNFRVGCCVVKKCVCLQYWLYIGDVEYTQTMYLIGAIGK